MAAESGASIQSDHRRNRGSHAIIGFDRNARDYLIGPTEAKGRSFLAGCLFKKDEPGHDHTDAQPLPASKVFAQHRHGNQNAKQRL
jgi:hypothetical protein